MTYSREERTYMCASDPVSRLKAREHSAIRERRRGK
jgi:hypothetical protein